MKYFSSAREIIPNFSNEHVSAMYDRGFVFTRLAEGEMHQTRSLRIDLSEFELSSENKRILKKTEELTLEKHPLPYANYDWSTGKMGKDFYEKKFGDGTFSANKIKELMTGTRRDFNTLFVYNNLGYCIAVETDELVHYSYPFYDLEKAPKDMGLGMMTRAVVYAKEEGKKYLYLGSFQRPTDTYKLQFSGMEWFDGKEWQTNVEVLKEIEL